MVSWVVLVICLIPVSIIGLLAYKLINLNQPKTKKKEKKGQKKTTASTSSKTVSQENVKTDQSSPATETKAE